MGGTIVVRCLKCNEKMDWDPLSEDPKICDDCKEGKQTDEEKEEK